MLRKDKAAELASAYVLYRFLNALASLAYELHGKLQDEWENAREAQAVPKAREKHNRRRGRKPQEVHTGTLEKDPSPQGVATEDAREATGEPGAVSEDVQATLFP